MINDRLHCKKTENENREFVCIEIIEWVQHLLVAPGQKEMNWVELCCIAKISEGLEMGEPWLKE